MDLGEFDLRARAVGYSGLQPENICLTDQVVIVTGGGGGIGAAVALGAANCGADVAILESDPDRCAAVEADLEAIGRRALVLQCDVIDTAALRASIRRIQETFGVVSALVNNVGGVRPGPFLTLPEDSLRRSIDRNLVSALVAAQEVGRVMVANGRGGTIVNVASIEGMRAAPMYAVYAACKAALINITRTLALELGEHGIRVNAIAPDHTVTPGIRGNSTGPVDPDSWAPSDPSWRRVIPLGREGLADECAAVVVWLCSAMSSYVTGVTINVDGGTWASGGWLRDEDGHWIQKP